MDKDLIEGVILLPENLFYNTSSAGIIIFLNKNKKESLKGKIILLNATQECYKGKPKNHISEESIEKIVQAFICGENVDRFLRVVDIEEVRAKDYNLSPARYVSLSKEILYRPLPDILSDLSVLQKESDRVDQDLAHIFKNLSL